MLGTFAGFLTINTFFLFLVIFGRFWPFWHFRDFWAFLGPPVGPPGPKSGLGCILRGALYHFRGLETTQGRPKCHLGKKFFSKKNFSWCRKARKRLSPFATFWLILGRFRDSGHLWAFFGAPGGHPWAKYALSCILWGALYHFRA